MRTTTLIQTSPTNRIMSAKKIQTLLQHNMQRRAKPAHENQSSEGPSAWQKNNCGCQNVETCDSGVYISSSISSVSHVNSEKAIQRHKPTISRTKDPA